MMAWLLWARFPVLVLLAGLVTYWRQKSVFTGISKGALVGNGIFSPAVRVPLGDVP